MAMDLEQYRTAIRDYLRDYDTQNRLLKFQQENTNSELDLYINMALGFLNSIPPPIGTFTYADFPIPALLMHQAIIECLISNGILASRNDLTYNNGGVTLRVADGDRYSRFLVNLHRLTEMEISNFRSMKISLNIEGGYGGVSSPYAWLHGRSATLVPNSILSG